MLSSWPHTPITLDDGSQADAIAPVVISASRSTDIPAFYGDWFMQRLAAGYCTWVNPWSGQAQHVSFSRARAAVFWTKNAGPFLRHLAQLDSLLPNYYFLYTLNDYDAEGLEPGVPSLAQRAEAFLRLSGRLGPERVVWRFDPLVLSDTLTTETLVSRIAALGRELAGATRRLVISFVDVERYPRVRQNLRSAGMTCREFTLKEKLAFAEALMAAVRELGLEVVTCAEEVDLAQHGISHSRCIDDRLLTRLFPQDEQLKVFLAREPLKDKGQRRECGCIWSKDIGRYDTCPHGCVYCYANSSAQAVQRSRELMGKGFPAALGPAPASPVPRSC